MSKTSTKIALPFTCFTKHRLRILNIARLAVVRVHNRYIEHQIINLRLITNGLWHSVILNLLSSGNYYILINAQNNNDYY